MSKLPAFMFYPGDWLRDPALRAVSVEARGLWIDMLCLMHNCDRRGYLQLNGKPVSNDQLARMTGCSTEQASRLLQELIDSGVCSANEHGCFSRRMVQDEAKRLKCVDAGRRGGNPALMGKSKGGSKGLYNRNQTLSYSDTEKDIAHISREANQPLAAGVQDERYPDWWGMCKDALDVWHRAQHEGTPMNPAYATPQTMLALLRTLETGPPLDAPQANGAALADLIRELAEDLTPWPSDKYAARCLKNRAEQWRKHGRKRVAEIGRRTPGKETAEQRRARQSAQEFPEDD